MRTAQSKCRTAEAFLPQRQQLRDGGRTLVFTNGCFDLLHVGHITYLQFARQQGDALVIGLNADASVQRAKGPTRPMNRLEDRALVLAALECVDFVIPFEEDEPAGLIARILPDVLVKGADWAHYVSGRDVVEAHGGRVVLADLVPGVSTTGLLAKHQTEVAS